MARIKKSERQQQLQEKLNITPFITDEELASFFGVSVPTIRLDRLALGIPELRERIKEMAREHASEYVDSYKPCNMVGELLDITKGERGISLLQTTDDMTDNNGIVEPHYLYAQANSLAKAVIGTNLAVTGVGNIKYKNPVKANNKLIAKAEVIRKRGDKIYVWVFTSEKDREVFRAKFIMESL